MSPWPQLLNDILLQLSKAANLSHRYTNQSIRATSLGILKKAGFSDRAVCNITGRKNPSLNAYNKPCDEEQQAMTKALDIAVAGAGQRDDESSSAVVSLGMTMRLRKMPTEAFLITKKVRTCRLKLHRCARKKHQP